MNDENSILWKKVQEKWLTRRNLIRGAAGTAAGAGLLLGSGLRLSALADGEEFLGDAHVAWKATLLRQGSQPRLAG